MDFRRIFSMGTRHFRASIQATHKMSHRCQIDTVDLISEGIAQSRPVHYDLNIRFVGSDINNIDSRCDECPLPPTCALVTDYPPGNHPLHWQDPALNAEQPELLPPRTELKAAQDSASNDLAATSSAQDTFGKLFATAQLISGRSRA